jgi:hypothetical protein
MWRKSEGSCKASTLSPHYYFIPLSPYYSNLGQLVGQQCYSVKVLSYVYPLHMNMLKHFLYIQYGWGKEVRGVVKPQYCHHIITSSHYPKITQIWVNLLASSVTVLGCPHMPIHCL